MLCLTKDAKHGLLALNYVFFKVFVCSLCLQSLAEWEVSIVAAEVVMVEV